MTAEIDVFCAGIACWDLAFSVDRDPLPDEKTLSRRLDQGGGGPATTGAGTVASLGGRSTLASYLGKDWIGEAVKSQLLEKGVPLDCIFWTGMDTPLSAILVKPDGKRSIVTNKCPEPEVDLESLVPTLQRSRFLLVDPHWPKLATFLVEKARDLDIPSMVDAGSLNEASMNLSRRVDYCVSSQVFAECATGLKEPGAMLAGLEEFCSNVVITLGIEGSIWKIAGKSGSTPAYPVDVVDTTGAGDIFHGALALALSRRENPAQALQFASRAAAVGCTRPGSLSAVPKFEELIMD